MKINKNYNFKISLPTALKGLQIHTHTHRQNFNKSDLKNNIIYIKLLRHKPRHLDTACCCSVAQLCPTICEPMDCSTPGFPIPHHLLECAQTHLH